jgi:hypothetical protein
MDSKTIRKLGPIEIYLHYEIMKGGSKISCNGEIESEIDLFKNVDLVKCSIEKWMNLHPFLRCKIVKYITNEQKEEFYFEYIESDKLNKLENVLFLEYLETDDSSNNKKIKITSNEQLFEYISRADELTDFDLENGPLWKLIFLKYHERENNKNTSNFFFKLHHSIMDGKSGYYCLLHLFEIIEDYYLHQNMNKNYIELNVLPNVNELCFNPENKIKRGKESGPKFVNIPNFLLPVIKNVEPFELTNTFIGGLYDLNHNLFVSINELIECSTKNRLHMKSFTFENSNFDELLLKCKYNGVKLTSFLNTVFAISLGKLYESHKDDTRCFKTATTISLREYPPLSEILKDEKQKYATLGFYVTYLTTLMDVNPLFQTKEIYSPSWIQKFWSYTKNESEAFHLRLKNEDHLKTEIRDDSIKMNDDKMVCHFGITNLGLRRNSISKHRLIKVKKNFTTGTYMKETKDFESYIRHIFFAFCESVDSTLFLNIYTDTRFVPLKEMDLFFRFMNELLNKLIKD